MDQLFGSLKRFVKPPSCKLDNFIYQLHYKFSVMICLAFSIMVTARQYFGDPIDCISRDDIPSKILDTYCWIHTTFSVESAWFKKVGVEVPYPGVDKYSHHDQARPEGKRIYHAYYQWVCFALFFQALGFYIPRWIWKTAEGGKIKSLIMGLDKPLMEDELRLKSRQTLVEYLVRHSGQHGSAFLVYVFTEFLNLANVIIQMFLINRFLNGEFLDYGWKVLQFTEWDWSVRYDPMIRVFPRLTKCTFHRYGSSGDVQRHDAMCILPINIINEKIYCFLWFWFYFLAVVTLVALLYRLLIVMIPGMRVMATSSRCSIVNRETVDNLCHHLSAGDWFLLDLLSKNMDPFNFRDLVVEYYQEIDRSKPIEP